MLDLIILGTLHDITKCVPTKIVFNKVILLNNDQITGHLKSKFNDVFGLFVISAWLWQMTTP